MSYGAIVKGSGLTAVRGVEISLVVYDRKCIIHRSACTILHVPVYDVCTSDV